MKARTSFVSNSSSTSFIIGLPKHPEDVLELHRMLWGPKFRTFSTYGEPHSSADFAQTIFNDINQEKNQLKLDDKVIVNKIIHGYFEGYPKEIWKDFKKHASYIIEKQFEQKHNKRIWECVDSHPELYSEWRELQRVEQEEELNKIKKAAQKYWLGYKDQFKGLKVYIVEYSDNDGDYYSTMEHGQIFDKVPHLEISHH